MSSRIVFVHFVDGCVRSILQVDGKANFSYNKIEMFSINGTNSAKGLIVLDLSHNLVQSINKNSLSRFTELEEIYFQDNEIRYMSIIYFPNLFRFLALFLCVCNPLIFIDESRRASYSQFCRY